MKQLPSPEVYEQELNYLPWGSMIEKMIEYGIKAPKNFRVLDLMCGTGYLLGKIAKQRKDLELTGVDKDERFIEYAKKQYRGITFVRSDVLKWRPDRVYDLIFCTGALHHLPYEKQPKLIKKISKSLSNFEMSAFIMADSFIINWITAKERKLAALKLGIYYIESAIGRDAPADVLEATISIMYNDVVGLEYKTSVYCMEKVLRTYFHYVQVSRINHMPVGHGDYYFICQNRLKKRKEGFSK